MQSIRMLPGSSIAMASSAVTTADVRCTGFDTRASISSLRERSMALRGQNPRDHPRSSVIRSGEIDCLDVMPSVDLIRVEQGSDAVSVDGVRAICLDRVRQQIRSELDHSGPRVLAPLLVQGHRQAVDLLEQGGEQEADGPCADHVDLSSRG